MARVNSQVNVAMRYSKGKLSNGPQAPQWSLSVQDWAIASHFSAGEDSEAIAQFIFRVGLGKNRLG
jgi:hypothetical protein